MVGIFLYPVSAMLWEVLLVMVCFTTASTCQALARKWHHARKWQSASVSSQNSLTRLALMWFALRLVMARDHLCRAEWISGLRMQRQHREHHVSLVFELSTHESWHSIQLSLVLGCARCSGWRVSSSSVSTAHMSFNLRLTALRSRCPCSWETRYPSHRHFQHGNPLTKLFLLCNHGTLRYHAHGSPNPRL